MESEADVEESPKEDNVLYDLTIHAEWSQEPETLNRGPREKQKASLAGRITSAASRTTWTIWRSIGLPARTGTPCLLPAGLVKLVSSQMNWHVAITKDGKQVAVLQDQFIEVRSDRDDFGAPLGRWSVYMDTHPQWRHLAWSPEGDMIACTSSSGRVDIYDVFGTPACTIQGKPVNPEMPLDLSNAVCSLIFKESEEEGWDTELLVVNYQGSLKSYSVQREGGVKENHSYSFASHYPQGISDVTYIPQHSILIVGGGADPYGDPTQDKPSAMQFGVTAWRLLSGSPHYKLVTDYEQDLQAARRRRFVMKKLKNIRWYGWSQEEKDGIYKLSLSPDGNKISAIHHSGRFSIFEIPSLRILHTWQQSDQPAFDEVNQEMAQNPKVRKNFKEQLKAFYLTDSNWWSDEAVILARGTGALTVSSARSLKNLLGSSPEWFDPAPRVNLATDGGFLGLECEFKYSSMKRHHDDDNEDYEDSDEDGDATMLSKSSKYMKAALYFVTDSDRFQPPRKRPKVVTKTYRLVCLKSTTPEELYTRKIADEEYGEALALAKVYKLDCDRVYQSQWRKTPVSVASIHDYLSKINKRSWVLHECMERVPENIDAMRELLQYGLRGTDLEALIAIGKGTDQGTFILCDNYEAYEESIDTYDEESVEESKRAAKEKRAELIKQVDFKKLNLHQIELCRARIKLLQYMDRLSTYEEILGGLHRAAERYDYAFFSKFRQQNIVEVAADYARACDWSALDIVETYHGKDTLPHRLPILCNFPETSSPQDYMSLLPGVLPEGTASPWEQHVWREPDWVESTSVLAVIDPIPADKGAFLYEENPQYEAFRGLELSVSQIEDWYRFRASEIEERSGQVENALEMINIAMDKNVQNLDELYNELTTLDTMVYDCQIDYGLSLKTLQSTPNIDKLRLMMSRSSPEMYDKNVKKWLVPFLERCETQDPGSFNHLIHDYLVSMAKTDLSLCLIIFKASRADQPNPVISDEMTVISLALECIYACECDDQLSNAFGILECLPQRGFGVVSGESSMLHNQVDELECHLSAAEILENNANPLKISRIRDIQASSEETKKLFTKLTRVAGKKSPPLREKQWMKLLTDILTLRDKLSQNVDSDVCYEIFVESLLCSSSHENIQLAGKMMKRSAAESREPDYSRIELEGGAPQHKVSYPRAVQLVKDAGREYFDSSSSLTDACMDLARACLSLISDMPPEVQEDLDLIEALAFLDTFGVSILPIQVRLCKDRLTLLQKAIDAKQNTYKKTKRLLELGTLLRLGGDSEVDREGLVHQAIAKTAFKLKDYNVCHDSCQRAMKIGFPSIWNECMALAEIEEFDNINVKSELLSFAVTHCSGDMIEPILRAKSRLETQILYERVNSQMSDRSSLSPEESPLSARGAIHQTKEILNTTNRATKAVLSRVSDQKWWTKTLRSIQRSNSVTEDTDASNEKFEKQGCHPFYKSILGDAYKNKTDGDLKNYKLCTHDLGGLTFNESVIRTSQLDETLPESETANFNAEVLLHLAEDNLPLDLSLGLSYLMALPEDIDADKCFEKVPNTAISLQAATYYFALQLYCRLQESSDPEPDQAPRYLYPPAELTQRILGHVTWRRENGKDWPEELLPLVEKLMTYNERLIDFTQAQVLEELGRGVDVGRFTKDAEYKRETILGLAMCLEDSVYNIAVSLAKRYNIQIWEVYMAHLEFLFDSGELTTEEIVSCVKQTGILPTLREQGEVYVSSMVRSVYPTIAGSDHDRLLCYYNLLEGCTLPDNSTPATHIKNISKIKLAAPGLDYKKLVDGSQNPLDVIRPILTSDNIHALAKVASKIPLSSGGFIQPSVVFCAWAIHVFWEGQPGKKVPETTADWLHRYEACGEYMNKMIPDDIIQFIDSIVFVQQSLDKLEVDCRQQIVKRAMKFSRQQAGGGGVGKKNKPSPDVTSSGNWEAVIKFLQQSTDHLNKLTTPVLMTWKTSSDTNLQTFAREYDLSRSDNKKVEALLVNLVYDGQTPETVDEVVSKIPTRLNTKTTFTTAICRLLEAIRETSEEADTNLLKSTIKQIGKHEEEGGSLIDSEDAMVLLRPFCSDRTVSVQQRREILQVLEQSFNLDDKDLVLLILYRTQATVTKSWADKKLDEGDIVSEESRLQLLHSLLRESEELEQFLALVELLRDWPHMEDELSQRTWLEVLEKMIDKTRQLCCDSVFSIVKSLERTSPFSEPNIEKISEKLIGSDMILTAVKVILCTQNNSLYSKATEQLSGCIEPEKDDILLQLILLRHLTSELVHTVYYPPLVEYILSHQGTSQSETPYHLRVETVANQLQDVGHDAEAGSLMIQHRGLHPALRTFDAALGLASKWFFK